ncbi:DUF305 domain-containing protein [Streptomyces sp. NPDC058371]|uniref:DUF305 domain-containing protein n=1 Tax=Streptomyces sp. NPDC058371 TaxID=3346463 RepID=UPI0036690EDF
MATAAARVGRAGGAPLVAALLCVLSTVSGCAGAQQSAGPPAPATSAAGSPAAVSGSAGRSTGTFNSTDVAWIQLLIAMDDQAGTVLQLAPQRGDDPALKRWAAGVARDNRTHLTALRRLLDDAGVPDSNPHEGHDMPGMVNAGELQTLKSTSGAKFDGLLRSALREHLTQAESMARAEQDNGSAPDVTKLAATVEHSTAGHRRRMPG